MGNGAMKTSTALLIIAAWLACPALAGAQQEEPSCDGAYTFVADGEVAFKLARVKGAAGQRSYFFSDDGACPNGSNCRKRSYLVPGDEAIVSSTTGRFACIWFQPAKGSETIGWMLSENLEFVEFSRNPNPADWLGAWSYRDNSLNIERGERAGELAVAGTAIWHGAGDNFHVGDIESTGTPKGHVLKLGDDTGEECQATLWLIGRLLVAADNLRCGGMNVTFAGVYSKGRS